eukprot:CAMPEP_0179135730 /NCGR_PEP_ID=MMETSP0796-20121207/64639_1 /TAXON_ID=73915 /ORGANISM="Pyrodinium bahamense, Strain pbaha01" /LENGTH=837 /DNA_ID=CAMNT_0020834767 /DNA_START=33 /DNA_END=2543 /DNA_ORIENTATION=+
MVHSIRRRLSSLAFPELRARRLQPDLGASGSLRITGIEVFAVELPLKVSYSLRGGRVWCHGLDTTLVKVVTDVGHVGWGEACPWGLGYGAAHPEGIRSAMDLLGPAVLGADPRHLADINRRMDAVLPGNPYTKSALDVACWDIFGRASGMPLYALLGGDGGGAVLGNSSLPTGTPEEMAQRVRDARAKGYLVHSMKVGGTDAALDIARVLAIQAELRAGELATFDVNGAWSPGTAVEVMNAVKSEAPGWFEQPCPTIEMCAKVNAQTPQPILLDEAMHTLGDHEQAHQLGACLGVKIKPMRLGGLTKCLLVRNFCLQHGWQMHIEDTGGSALADTAALQLARSTPEEYRLASWLAHEHLATDLVADEPQEHLLGEPIRRYGSSAAFVTAVRAPQPPELGASHGALPQKMQAMLLVGHGGPEQLQLHQQFPVPAPSAHEVVLRVRACGLNNTDVNTRVGWYAGDNQKSTEQVAAEAEHMVGGQSYKEEKMQFPRVQGANVCGVVVAVGTECCSSLIGQRVVVDPWVRDWSDPLNMEKMTYLGSELDGGYAEFCCVPRRNIHDVTDIDLSDEQLATFACNYVAAEAMLHGAKVGRGDVVLVLGSSGGVGAGLVQLAKARGARVAAVTRADKMEAVRELLAPDAVLPRKALRSPEALREGLRAAGLPDDLDVVADVVGGPDAEVAIATLARGGRYTTNGCIAGAAVSVNLKHLIYRNVSLSGHTFAPSVMLPGHRGPCSARGGEAHPSLRASACGPPCSSDDLHGEGAHGHHRGDALSQPCHSEWECACWATAELPHPDGVPVRLEEPFCALAILCDCFLPAVASLGVLRMIYGWTSTSS